MSAASTGTVVSVVIPTHDRTEKLLRCIESVKASDADGLELEIIVAVDRNPAVKPALQQRHPDVVVLESRQRLGSQGGRALGARGARGEYIFFVDDDNVLDRDCIATLVHTMSAHPEVGLLGPLALVFGAADEVWCAGARLSRVLSLASHRYAGDARVAVPPVSLLPCDYVPNAYMVRREAAGLVDKVSRLFPHLWCEIAVAAELQACGATVAVAPACCTWHDVGYGGKVTRIGEGWTDEQARARLLWRRIYRPGLLSMSAFWLIVFPASSLAYALRFRRVGGTTGHLKAYLRGTWQGLRTPARYPDRPLFR